MKEYTDSLTVADLIRELQQLHPAFRVLVKGCDDISVYDITQIIPDDRGFVELCSLNSHEHMVLCECGHDQRQHNSLDSRPFGKWNCTYCECGEYEPVAAVTPSIESASNQRAWMKYADTEQIPHDHEDESSFKYGFDAGVAKAKLEIAEEIENHSYLAGTHEMCVWIDGLTKRLREEGNEQN